MTGLPSRTNKELHMRDIIQTVKKKANILVLKAKKNPGIVIILSLVFSFAVPFSILYYLDPILFERTWIGRTFYLFFLWLVILEIILDWEKLQKTKLEKPGSIRKISFITALLLPTLYVVIANYGGLNLMIENLAKQNNMQEHYAKLMRIPVEYLAFAVFFGLMVLLAYGKSGLIDFSTSTFFLGIIGTLYAINNLYPDNRFTPFQMLVPATANLAAGFLNWMGYQTAFLHSVLPGVPRLAVLNAPGGFIFFDIAWPCAGIESLLIYTVVIVLFLKKSSVPWWQRIIYFAIGALVTYFLNVLRIVTIFLIAIGNGDWHIFHDYYGLLYSVSWIISYPLIIVGSQALWGKIRSWRVGKKDPVLTS
jgi:exosortase/archaeosortase family protein